MKHRYIIGLMILLSGGILFSSCRKDPMNQINEEESRIYITNFDETVDFTSYATFSISDSVAVIENNSLSGHALTSWDAAFRSAMISNLISRGYTLVDRDADPDLGINLSRVYNTYTGVIDYGNYWGNYYGYYDPYYWGYPGYNYYFPPMYGFYEINEGAATVDLLDLKNSEANNQIAGIWNALFRGTGVFDAGTIAQQVDAVFDQSPYLKRN